MPVNQIPNYTGAQSPTDWGEGGKRFFFLSTVINLRTADIFSVVGSNFSEGKEATARNKSAVPWLFPPRLWRLGRSRELDPVRAIELGEDRQEETARSLSYLLHFLLLFIVSFVGFSVELKISVH